MTRREKDVPLFDEEVEVHPLWIKPSDTETGVSAHVLALRKAMWSAMQPFDGRPDFDQVVGFAYRVYWITSLEPAQTNVDWLLARLVYQAHAASTQPRAEPRQTKVIRRLADEWTYVLAGHLS